MTTERPLRIAFVDANPRIVYGAQRRMTVLAGTLRTRHEVTVVTTEAGALERHVRDVGIATAVLPAAARINRFGGEVLRDGALGRAVTVAAALAWTVRFAAWLMRRRIDVVVANDTRSALLVGIACRMTGRGLVWTVRDDHRQGRFHALAARFAHRVVTVSDAVQRVFTDAERRRLGARLRTIYNGVPIPDVPANARGRLRALASGTDATKLLVLTGMLTPRKGHADALRALAQVRSDGTSVALAIIGDAPEGYATYARDMRALANELGVGHAVVWLGHRDDAIALAAGADLLVLPSSHEGLPGVLVEAIGVGVPVVAYDASGADEVVGDPSFGSVVPMGDVDALTNAARRWLAADPKPIERADDGRAYVEGRFGVERYVAEYEALLRSLAIHGRRGEGAS